MIAELINSFFSNLMFITLHLNVNSSFPPPLSAAEESECLKKIKEGDISAKQKLIEHNLRLVAHIIKKYYSNYCDQEDLISIGTIGLIKAIDNFDLTQNVQFSTYAVPMNIPCRKNYNFNSTLTTLFVIITLLTSALTSACLSFWKADKCCFVFVTETKISTLFELANNLRNFL